jgi:hypothetical protein
MYLIINSSMLSGNSIYYGDNAGGTKYRFIPILG